MRLLTSIAGRRSWATMTALVAVLVGVAGCGSGSVKRAASSVAQTLTNSTGPAATTKSNETSETTPPKTTTGATTTGGESSGGSGRETGTIAQKTTSTKTVTEPARTETVTAPARTETVTTPAQTTTVVHTTTTTTPAGTSTESAGHAGAAAVVGAKAATNEESSESSGLPGWAWALIGAAAAVLLTWGVIAIRNRRSRQQRAESADSPPGPPPPPDAPAS